MKIIRPSGKKLYYCNKCKYKHTSGSKVYKKHHKHAKYILHGK